MKRGKSIFCGIFHACLFVRKSHLLYTFNNNSNDYFPPPVAPAQLHIASKRLTYPSTERCVYLAQRILLICINQWSLLVALGQSKAEI